MSEPKKMCPCGNPQSYPIPHEHDQTEREKVIIKHFRDCHEELEQRDTIMVEALAEIKALAAGDSNPEQPQSIKEIVNSCIEELAALAMAKEE